MHGGAGPWWLGVLGAAREWGTVPWKIADGPPALWYLRWLEYNNLLAKKQQSDEKKWRRHRS